MIQQLGFQLFDGPTGDMLADFSQAERLEISDGEHGFEALTAYIPMPESEAFRWYAMPGVPWAVVSGSTGVAWEGRVEDVAVVDGGLEIGAFGAWRALSDLPYTALWSRTATAGWRPVTVNDAANRSPERYEMDNNNRLYIGLRNGESYGNNTDVGELTYAAPHNGTRTIVAFSASYDQTLPTNWQLRIQRRENDDFSGGVNDIQIITGTGSNQTGTINQTFTGNQRIVMQLRNATGATYTMTGASGSFYCRLTNIRIKTTTAATVTADLIATHMVSLVNGLNGSQIRNITALIQNPGRDLTDELYEDDWPADILTYLAQRGDSNGNQYEVGVWENRTLHLRPRYGASRTWLVDARDLTVSRSMDSFRNQMYAVYRDANNRLKRTTVQTNIAPLAASSPTDLPAAPFFRRGYVDAQTTSQGQAELERDVRITDTAVITPRAGFRVDELYDEAGGGPYPLWMARAGDLVIIRNLSPGLGTAVDRLRNFRIKRKRYNVIENVLELTPELELPDLAVMAADSLTAADRTRPYTRIEG